MFRRSAHHASRTASFTLVEMLVIISIVSLLSSIAFTGLQEARAMARDARRMTLLHDLRLSLEQYYDEYGFYPPNMGDQGSGATYVSNNAEDFPFVESDVAIYDADVGSTLNPNPASGVRFMQHLVDSGLWNEPSQDGSFIISGDGATDWPYRQPNGTLYANKKDVCGGFIKYSNVGDWWDPANNPNGYAKGPQSYLLRVGFERKKTFDAFWANDKDALQYDGHWFPANNPVSDNEYMRTALQTNCPWGSSLYVYIDHCAGEWKPRDPPYHIADDQRGYPGDIPMSDCWVDGVKVEQED